MFWNIKSITKCQKYCNTYCKILESIAKFQKRCNTYSKISKYCKISRTEDKRPEISQPETTESVTTGTLRDLPDWSTGWCPSPCLVNPSLFMSGSWSVSRQRDSLPKVTEIAGESCSLEAVPGWITTVLNRLRRKESTTGNENSKLRKGEEVKRDMVSKEANGRGEMKRWNEIYGITQK